MENQGVWKDTKGYEGEYQASNYGSIKSLKHGKERILKQRLRADGYQQVALYNGTAKRHLVHRLIAIAFIPNPENKRTVNHINGIRTDNRVGNLEWATYSENGLHSYRELGRNPSRPQLGKYGKDHNSSKSVSQYSKEGKFINTFVSQREAEKITGIANGSISLVCSGGRKSAGGYLWKFDNNK